MFAGAAILIRRKAGARQKAADFWPKHPRCFSKALKNMGLKLGYGCAATFSAQRALRELYDLSQSRHDWSDIAFCAQAETPRAWKC